MVSSMTHLYPTVLDITYGRGNYIVDDNPADDDKINYDPADGYSNTSDPEPGTPNGNSIANNTNNGLDDDGGAIIINYDGVDHHGLISGVETNLDDQHDDQDLP